VSVRTAGELAAWFAPLRDDEETLRRVSRTAKDYTARNQGATGIILRSIFNS